MKLEVPLILSPECGIACLEMVLKYHGENTSRANLLKEFKIYKEGTYSAQLGKFLIEKGFGVRLALMNPAAFTLRDSGLSQGELARKLVEFSPVKKTNRRAKNYLLSFMASKGELEVKIPTIDDVVFEINNNRPIIANMTTRFFSGVPAKLNLHYNVITGYDSEFIYANDPGTTRGGEKKYRHHEFFFGLYATATELSDCSLLKIEKQ